MTIIQILQRIRMLVDRKDFNGLDDLSNKISDLLLPQEEIRALQGMVHIALQLVDANDSLAELERESTVAPDQKIGDDVP